VSGAPRLGIAIVVVIVLNAGFAFAEEMQAERAVEALAAFLPERATVLRDGSRREIEARLLVPGDVLLIEEGESICADARLMSGTIEVDMFTRATRLIAIVAVGAGIAFLPIGLAAGLGMASAASFAIGLLVANVPEGLLPTITLALAVGVREMARRGALVKRLSAAAQAHEHRRRPPRRAGGAYQGSSRGGAGPGQHGATW